MSWRRFQLGSRGEGSAWLYAWYGGTVLLVVLAPTQVWTGRPVWSLPPEGLAQAILLACATLAIITVLLIASVWQRSISAGAVAGIVLGCLGAAMVFPAVRQDLTFSRGVFLVGAALAALLPVVPFLVRTIPRGVVLGLQALVLVFIVTGLIASMPQPASGVVVSTIRTSSGPLEVRRFKDVTGAPPSAAGGAIVAHDEGFLLVERDGSLSRLTWAGGTDSLHVQPLAPPVSLRSVSPGDQAELLPPPALHLRTTDILVDTTTSPARVLVAHQFWHSDRGCMTMRVSSMPWEHLQVEPERGPATWETVFESRPCLSLTPEYENIESGGKLALDAFGQLYLTLGDFGFDGRIGHAFAQEMDNDYGKVLRRDRGGNWAPFSMGHRNPQGLAIDANGLIWATEHGPQGGDEINMLVEGGNYGWPLATYGTDYGLTYWPLARGARHHGEFREPRIALVPSVGISALLVVSGRARLEEWRGDLLVGSLARETLFRVRTRGDRILYLEPIRLGVRVRHLTEGQDGRILVWSDAGEVLVLSPGDRTPEAQGVFGICARCHEPDYGAERAAAPSLRGILGRPVAGLSWFAYSSSLSAAGGTWTDERLHAFLENPSAFAPGTPMGAWGIPDLAERTALIEFLKSYRP